MLASTILIQDKEENSMPRFNVFRKYFIRFGHFPQDQ